MPLDYEISLGNKIWLAIPLQHRCGSNFNTIYLHIPLGAISHYLDSITKPPHTPGLYAPLLGQIPWTNPAVPGMHPVLDGPPPA